MPYGFRMEPSEEGVSKARHRILTVVREWGVSLSDEALSDLALMSSELVTNAVRHTGASCAVVVRWTGARLRVEVTDTDSREPKVGDGAVGAESGRGLLLVESIAADWGSAQVLAGKTVWFEILSAASPMEPAV